MIHRSLLHLSMVVALAAAGLMSCTIEGIEDEIRVVENVPPPSGAGAAHRLSRNLGLGGDSSRVDAGRFTFVRLRVIGPEGADLFPYLRINLRVRTSEGAFELAEATDFQEGETSRDLDVLYTSDITRFLADEDLTVEWDIFYKTSPGNYPSTGIELETVVGVSVDVEIL